jgi:hypothetical protein
MDNFGYTRIRVAISSVAVSKGTAITSSLAGPRPALHESRARPCGPSEQFGLSTGLFGGAATYETGMTKL